MKALGALVFRSTCASSLCQGSLSGSSASSEIVVLEPGWLRHVCCSCEVLGGSVRIEAEQMSWLALFVCHICQMAFFGKSLAKKSPKQHCAAKMFNFLCRLQQIEISRKTKLCCDAPLFPRSCTRQLPGAQMST